jgi:hypothetical protein
MTLMRDGKPVQGPNGNVQIVTGPAPHNEATVAIECVENSEFVNHMLAGDEIVFSVVVGEGGGHKLYLKSLLVTLPTSTLVYHGPSFEKRIVTDPAIRNLYHRFPLVTHPHKSLPNRDNWVPRIKRAQVAVNWDAVALLNEYETKNLYEGKDVRTLNIFEAAKGNNSIGTVLEVWKGGANSFQGNLWTNAPDPEGLKGPDLWEVDVPDTLLEASQLPRDSAEIPVEWAISIWYQKDNHWVIFRRETHLQIFTFAVFVEYQW